MGEKFGLFQVSGLFHWSGQQCTRQCSHGPLKQQNCIGRRSGIREGLHAGILTRPSRYCHCNGCLQTCQGVFIIVLLDLLDVRSVHGSVIVDHGLGLGQEYLHGFFGEDRHVLLRRQQLHIHHNTIKIILFGHKAPIQSSIPQYHRLVGMSLFRNHCRRTVRRSIVHTGIIGLFFKCLWEIGTAPSSQEDVRPWNFRTIFGDSLQDGRLQDCWKMVIALAQPIADCLVGCRIVLFEHQVGARSNCFPHGLDLDGGLVVVSFPGWVKGDFADPVKVHGDNRLVGGIANLRLGQT
mmetsp:Transcript_1791/g.3177  ORF Transcript_1791/g.3177 Transcript_1791/m.3177 type:complete len:293 (-) Transcript_1791:363-1241(-)